VGRHARVGRGFRRWKKAMGKISNFTISTFALPSFAAPSARSPPRPAPGPLRAVFFFNAENPSSRFRGRTHTHGHTEIVGNRKRPPYVRAYAPARSSKPHPRASPPGPRLKPGPRVRRFRVPGGVNRRPHPRRTGHRAPMGEPTWALPGLAYKDWLRAFAHCA